jgi:hypothetical protein
MGAVRHPDGSLQKIATPPPFIPGRAKREPGNHNHESLL